MKKMSFKPLDCHQSGFCGFGASYRQPQVCRGCLVGILMRQLTEVSTQCPQVQPKPMCTTPAESQEETCLRLPPDSHHQHFPSKYPKSLRFTFAVILLFTPTPPQSWHKTDWFEHLNEEITVTWLLNHMLRSPEHQRQSKVSSQQEFCWCC